jgi:hemerythrin
MAYMKWLPEYELGIPAIDSQHKRIVEYINKLDEARALGNGGYTAYALEELVDYTLTHFEFEEALQEKAGYPFLKAHRRIHEIFVKRIASLRERFERGEDITTELLDMLRTWLSGHIRSDDRDYGDMVAELMAGGEWLDASLADPLCDGQPG